MAEVVPIVELSVVMHCEGCAGAVRKTLKKIPGVQSYTVDYTQQKAIVVGSADPETILSSIRKSGKMASLAVKGPPSEDSTGLQQAPPKEEKKVESEIKKEEEAGAEEKKEEKQEKQEKKEEKEEKKEAKPRFSFRSKMPKMPSRPKMPKMSNLKFQDLQKRMPDICNSMPKNFMTNACREFMTHGVFYVATDDVSDSEKESLKD